MRQAAETIKELDVPIDGIMGFPTVTAAAWELTSDGVEGHFQRNYLCYFVLFKGLLERLSDGARVVLMTTSVRQEAAAPMWEDVNFNVSGNGILTLGMIVDKADASSEWRVLSST